MKNPVECGLKQAISVYRKVKIALPAVDCKQFILFLL